MSKKGWFDQKMRHSLASRGIPTKYEDRRRVRKEFELKSIGFDIEKPEQEKIFDGIAKIFKDVGIYFNSEKEGNIYVFEFYEPPSLKKHSRAKLRGDEVHIKVSSGGEYDSILEAVYLFNLAGYYFDVEWKRDDFEVVLDFGKFYSEEEWNRAKKSQRPERKMGTKFSGLFKNILDKKEE